MLHFQTTYYGTHKALDDYLTKFDINFDRFMEVAQHTNKVGSSNIRLDIKLRTDSDIDSYLSSFLSDIIENKINEYTTDNGLLAIRDEMVADINQLRYLLRFK